MCRESEVPSTHRIYSTSQRLVSADAIVDEDRRVLVWAAYELRADPALDGIVALKEIAADSQHPGQVEAANALKLEMQGAPP